MKYKILMLILVSFSLNFAQPRDISDFWRIKGKVLNSEDKAPMQYANILVFNLEDSTQEAGVVTDKSGEFKLIKVKPGDYFIRVSFIGFEEKVFENIKLGGKGSRIDLGDILLSPKLYSTDDIVVKGERAPISYEIDKKVINVDEQFTASSGSAVDVLENVPSVTVDIEGNVSLRGSTNFTVLIDGRPSILDPSDALDQIPASSIENIEIITNPSAKYDPQGSAGIINIILKKNMMSGISGILNLNSGWNNKYGGDGVFDYKSEKWDVNLAIDYRNYLFEMDQTQNNYTINPLYTSYLNSLGGYNFNRKGYGFKTSLTYFADDNNLLMIGGGLGNRGGERDMDLDYEEWNTQNNIVDLYSSIGDRERESDFYNLISNYTKYFGSKNHSLIFDFNYSYRNSNEETLNELRNSDGMVTEGRITTENGPSNEYVIKLDYMNKFSEEGKIEAGVNSELDWSTDNSGLSEYNTFNGNYQFLEEFSNSSNFNRNIFALYTTYSNKIGDFGYQIGLRTEYTFRETQLIKTDEYFNIDRWDYFPGAHLSYKFLESHQLMLSYTKRIDRPRSWYLEPFYTWMDAYNLRVGNPSLSPEYIDSYEFGYQTYFGKTLISAELYYRINNNKVERVRSVYDDNITLHTIENVGKDFSFGSELMYNFDLIEGWNINLLGNLYNYKVEGELYGEDFSRESFNWNLRFNNNIKVFDNTQFQINGMYNSKTVSAQGESDGFFSTNLAIKQDFFQKALSLTLQIRDVLSTSEYSMTEEAPNYYNYRLIDRESPIVMLSLKFNFNNFKQQRERGEGGRMNGEMEDEF